VSLGMPGGSSQRGGPACAMQVLNWSGALES